VERFLFWVETYSGERLVWQGLTKRRAEDMYSATKHCHSVKEYGWRPQDNSLSTQLLLSESPRLG